VLTNQEVAAPKSVVIRRAGLGSHDKLIKYVGHTVASLTVLIRVLIEQFLELFSVHTMSKLFDTVDRDYGNIVLVLQQ
jgi:hypothetical protein